MTLFSRTGSSLGATFVQTGRPVSRFRQRAHPLAVKLSEQQLQKEIDSNPESFLKGWALGSQLVRKNRSLPLSSLERQIAKRTGLGPLLTREIVRRVTSGNRVDRA